jgi:glutamate synthase (NADPH/NADH) small chain
MTPKTSKVAKATKAVKPSKTKTPKPAKARLSKAGPAKAKQARAKPVEPTAAAKPWEIPPPKMPEQDPKDRITNFREVNLGYSEAQVFQEANRCMQCKKPSCVSGCPVEIDIQRFLEAVRRKDYRAAIGIIKEKNSLPAICGRVCPQETQCQAGCVLGKKGKPVEIGRIERFLADWEREHGVQLPQLPKPTGHHVAIVGSGPAGLTAAGDLVLLGHKVTVFESLHELGGVLVYGIPEFRLPKAIVKAEVDYLRKLGVEFRVNSFIGQLYSLQELFNNGNDAILIATGAGLPTFLRIPGVNLVGTYSSNEFLTRVNLMRAYQFPEYDTPIIRGSAVAVIGGGNAAMDSARTALRLGAKKVTVVYRRGENEMPVRMEEYHHAREEGVQFEFLAHPVELLADAQGRVVGMRCMRNCLGEPDESGRRRPEPIPGSEFEMPVDTVIFAIGAAANPSVPRCTPDLKVDKGGDVTVDPDTLETCIAHVWAAGDIKGGEGTVIAAAGEGKRAARSVHTYLSNL